MEPEVIYGSDLIYRQYKWQNFKTNLANLRDALESEVARASQDAVNVAADKQRAVAAAATAVAGAGGAKIWAGSEAERLLKDDIDNNRHVGIPPRELRARADRPEYREWTLKEFRDHVEQEKRARTTSAYWLHRGKTKKEKKQIAETEEWPRIQNK
jgi:hypothetical protein